MAEQAIFRNFDHIYLSPHLDDAALSCGGRMAQQTARGERVLVVTICAGDPPAAPLSDFAQSLHEKWQLGRNAVEARRAEDEAALAVLGAEALRLPVPDAIYRRGEPGEEPLYPSREAIFGSLDPRERRLSLDLASRLADLGPLPPATRLYVPLGIGGHVDHQLTRCVADLWAGAHPNVFYYEDYPYAHDPNAVTQWIDGRGWRPHVALLGEADLARQARAVAAYRSQISTFWADEAGMAAALREHALAVGAGRGPADRVWARNKSG